EATAILHGREAAEKASATARQAFEQGGMAEGLPTITAKLPDGILNLAVAAGVGGGDLGSREVSAQNGLKVNDAGGRDPKLVVDTSALTGEGVLKLSSGKKKHVLVKPL